MLAVTLGYRFVRAPLSRAALSLVFAGAILQPAYADIYTWTDKNGSVNISNLPPPEGVLVTKTVRESAPRVVAPTDPAGDSTRQAEVQALAERVRQLEGELAVTQSQMPTPVMYQAMPPTPVIQYFVDAGSTQVQYNSVGQGGCGAGWADCGIGWNTGFFPGVVFVTTPSFRRFPPRVGHPAPAPPMMRGPGGSRRG